MELVCGVDEAGRGPLAGPVTAAAVILPPAFPGEVLADSKRLSPARRSELALRIRAEALDWGIGWASHGEVDRINILAASLLAMGRAIAQLTLTPDRIIVDGLHVPLTECPVEALVKADATIHSVMAASILAKTARDAWMVHYAVRDSRYGFDRHMGYPTRAHRDCIRLHGPAPIHRRTFRLLEDACGRPSAVP